MAYDLLIKNGWVVDGSGLPRYRGDVGVSGGRPRSSHRWLRESAREVIDAGAGRRPGVRGRAHHMDAQIFGIRSGPPAGTAHSVVMGNAGSRSPRAKETAYGHPHLSAPRT